MNIDERMFCILLLILTLKSGIEILKKGLREKSMPQCVILNADYTFLNMVDWKRAICLIVKGKVQILKHSEKIVRTAEGIAIKIPAVMRLMKLIRTLYINRVPFSKKECSYQRWIQVCILWMPLWETYDRSYYTEI